MKKSSIRVLSLLLCLLMLFALASCVGGGKEEDTTLSPREDMTTAQFTTIPEAPDTDGAGKYLTCSDWTMGAAWQDVSTDKTVAFKALNADAGPNFCKTKINGANGFLVSFDVHFEDATVQTTPLVDFRINSSTNHYMRILPTGIGNEAIFQVDFCNNGPWFNVVPCKRNIAGLVDSTLNVQFYVSKGANQIHFILSSGGQVIDQFVADNVVFDDLGFFSNTDLEFIVTPLTGYGLFTISNYSVSACDTGEQPISRQQEQSTSNKASDYWTLGDGWIDVSTTDKIAVKTTRDTASVTAYKTAIDASDGFSISYNIDFADAKVQTTPECFIRMSTATGEYFRILPTAAGTKAIFQVEYYGAKGAFSVVDRHDILDVVVDSKMTVTISSIANSNAITFKISSNGSTIYEETVTGKNWANGFLSNTSLIFDVRPISGYGNFTISDFIVQ